MPRARRIPREATVPVLPEPLLGAGAILDVMPAVMDSLRAAMRRQLGQTLSVPQFRCLRFIADNPACSVSEVAAFLGVTLATASATVERLARAGYVVSEVAAADRRRSELHCTRAGRSLMGRIRSGAQAEMAGALADCSAQELHEVMAGMAVLQRRFTHA